MSGAPQSRRNAAAEPVLDRAVQAQIGSKLRAMYGELIDQPVPDRLTAILGRLDGSDEGKGSPDGTSSADFLSSNLESNS